MKHDPGDRIGFGLNARGAMEIVLASVALIAMAFATTIAGSSMIQRLMMNKAFIEERRIDISTATY